MRSPATILASERRPHDIVEIVVPLDGSALAARALPVADALADQIGAKVRRITVVPADEHPVPGGITVMPGIGVTVTLPGDDVAATISAHLRASDGRIVCMSTHGRGRLGSELLGSVAEGVLRVTEEPLLLVGPGTQPPVGRITRIVACVDGSALSEAILPTASTWARDLGACLELVQVIPPPAGEAREAISSGDVSEAGYLSRLAHRLPEGGASVEWDVLHGRDPVEPILRHAGAVQGTVVALTTHGRSGWSRVAMGSVAMRLVHASPVPVLVQRPPNSDRTRED